VVGVHISFVCYTWSHLQCADLSASLPACTIELWSSSSRDISLPSFATLGRQSSPEMLLTPLAVVLSMATGIAGARALSTVHTRQGNISGIQCPGSATMQFLGIPFAQPPIGDLRFASPVAYNATYPSGHLNASTFGSSCPQFAPAFSSMTPPSEDWFVPLTHFLIA
jgi:hypothetical protein